MVSECAVKLLGDLPFDFEYGTCGTYMIKRSPTILLCFSSGDRNHCRSLTRKNGATLSEIKDFEFHTVFEIDTVQISNSAYSHSGAVLANYQGFPLILGGHSEYVANNKLEMLNTIENRPRWIQYEDANYPFSETLVIDVFKFIINKILEFVTMLFLQQRAV